MICFVCFISAPDSSKRLRTASTHPRPPPFLISEAKRSKHAPFVMHRTRAFQRPTQKKIRPTRHRLFSAGSRVPPMHDWPRRRAQHIAGLSSWPSDPRLAGLGLGAATRTCGAGAVLVPACQPRLPRGLLSAAGLRLGTDGHSKEPPTVPRWINGGQRSLSYTGIELLSGDTSEGRCCPPPSATAPATASGRNLRSVFRSSLSGRAIVDRARPGRAESALIQAKEEEECRRPDAAAGRESAACLPATEKARLGRRVLDGYRYSVRQHTW